MSNADKILVVEGSSTQRMILKLNLELESYHVITAYNGIDGVRKAYEEAPDLIISEIDLPGLTGYQLCHLLKNDLPTKHIPIVLLSSYEDKKNEFWAIESGADRFVKKSERQRELINTVQNLLKERQSMLREEIKEPDYSTCLNEEDAKSRINNLLDRLLFESKISNRIREIAKYAYDPIELMRTFFSLLTQLVHYSVAVVMIDHSDSIHLNICVAEKIASQSIDSLKSDLFDQAKQENKRKAKIEIFNKENISNESHSLLKANISTKFQIKDDVWGLLAIYQIDTNRNCGYDTEQILEIVSKELAMLIRYATKLEEIESIKADYTSMMVHDLRSPLAGVFGLLKLFKDERIGKVNNKQKKTLSQILETVNKLVNFINDMLDISKIEAGRLEIHKKRIRLQQVIQHVISNIKILADEKNISICNEYPHDLPEIDADEIRVEQIFVNLFTNAIKFSYPNSTVAIGGELTNSEAAENKYVKIWVKDTGVGIPATDLKTIFEKYQQSSNATIYRKGGTGLGLVVCKMIAEAHGGEIWAQSAENEGSTFYFTLPVVSTGSMDKL